MHEHLAAKTTDERLEELDRRWRTFGGAYAPKILRFSSLNPEQQLAFVLELLVTEGKTKLALMEIAKTFAERCTEWKKTPEGQAWDEEKAKKRAENSAQKGAT